MGFSERERPYNRLLGWLLDPQGDHGAGTALLRTAARALGLHHLEHECSRPDAGIEVRAEKPWPARAGSSREPDLLIRAPRSVLLVEHKVNAGEGEDQYSDYREALARLSAALGADESAAYLLSRRERPAPEGWRGVLSHRDVARWIRETAESPGIRSWARAVLQLSAQAFEGRSWAPRTSPAAALLASLEGRPPTPRDLIQVRQLLEELPVTPGAVWDER